MLKSHMWLVAIYWTAQIWSSSFTTEGPLGGQCCFRPSQPHVHPGWIQLLNIQGKLKLFQQNYPRFKCWELIPFFFKHWKNQKNEKTRRKLTSAGLIQPMNNIELKGGILKRMGAPELFYSESKSGLRETGPLFPPSPLLTIPCS